MGTSPNGAIAPDLTEDKFNRPAAAPSGLIPRKAAREMDVDALVVAGATTHTGDLTLAANLIFTAASAKIVPGATSLLFRNTADSASNLTITDAGLVTAVRGNVALTVGNLVFGAASAKILPGATSLLFRDTGDANTNIQILDSGAVTVRGAITPTGGIAAAGGFSLSPRAIYTGALPPVASTSGTDATPVATEVYIAEVKIYGNCSITGFSNFNGSVASGNLKAGLADSTGAIVATSASTAMVGTDAYQRIPFTAPYAAKGPATYYALLFVDNNTARINCHPFGDFGASKQTGQVYATGFTTITPPTTFTADLAPMGQLY